MLYDISATLVKVETRPTYVYLRGTTHVKVWRALLLLVFARLRPVKRAARACLRGVGLLALLT